LPRVAFITLGCKLNQLDTEEMSSAHLAAGGTVVNADDAPDIIVINTCTVTSKAEQKARRLIRLAMKNNPNARIVVTGCAANSIKEYFLNVRHEDCGRILFFPKEQGGGSLPLASTAAEGFVVGALHATPLRNGFATRRRFPLPPLLRGQAPLKSPGESPATNPSPALRARRLLKIQDGCNNACTFCAARLIRGKSASIAAGEILLKLQAMEEQGAREAVITGLNIAQYKDEKTGALPGLLEFLLNNTEHIAIRLSSLEPESSLNNKDFFRIIANRRVRPHFHLSIQSASQKILQRMGRSYTKEALFEIIENLRAAKAAPSAIGIARPPSAIPPFLACDIITGFPGETEEDFKETLDFCKKARFAQIHCFPYSSRPGTAAAKFKDLIPERLAVRRCGILTSLAKEGRAAYVQSVCGLAVNAIVEIPGELAISENYLRLKLCTPEDKTIMPHGAQISCKISPLEGAPGASALTEKADALGVECPTLGPRSMAQLGNGELGVGSWAEMGESRDGQIARFYNVPNSQLPTPNFAPCVFLRMPVK